MEIEATQSLNKRSGADKTYHLVVAFPPGEQPNKEVLDVVEKRLCDALGYGDHQRVSAVHHDTDSLHLHVAINKVHPGKFTVHTPFNDYKSLGRECERLEEEFGLTLVNHQSQKESVKDVRRIWNRTAGRKACWVGYATIAWSPVCLPHPGKNCMNPYLNLA